MISIEPNVTLSVSGLQALLGFLPSVFKVWIPSESDLSKELDLKRQVLKENVAKKMDELLRHSIELPYKQLRGTSPAPDYVGDYISELFRVVEVLGKMEQLHCHIRQIISYLIYTAISAVIFIAVAYIFPQAAVYVTGLSVAVIAMQIYWVIMIRKTHEKLDDYKKTT